MKRLHIHIKTRNLDRSVAFYTAMFGQAPSRREDDYAKWLLDDPAANIALSTHGGEPGVDHAGLSVDTKEELNAIADRLRREDAALLEEEAATCCYARSNKFWTRDPQDAVWELFHTFDDSPAYGAEPNRDRLAADAAPAPACC